MRLRDQIAVSELAMIFKRCLVVGLGGFDSGKKMTQKFVTPIHADRSQPWPIRSFGRFKKYHASESRNVVNSDSAVHHVLSMGGLTHIASGAIKAVAVFVVNTFTGETHKETVKKNVSIFSFSSLDIIMPQAFMPYGIPKISGSGSGPLETFYLFLVAIVYNGSLPLCKWNNNHRVIIA